MANRHVKTINGKKYYYESVRKGRKVTSRYIGPAENDTTKEMAEPVVAAEKPVKEEDLITPDDHDIG